MLPRFVKLHPITYIAIKWVKKVSKNSIILVVKFGLNQKPKKAVYRHKLKSYSKTCFEKFLRKNKNKKLCPRRTLNQKP
jgi:hypothetical protein